MKKISLILSIALLLLTSCTSGADTSSGNSMFPESLDNSSESTGVSLDYFSSGRFTATIVEDSENIYFAKKDGIYKKKKPKNTAERIYEVKRPNSLLLYADKLYFAISDGSDLYSTLCCIGKDGSGFLTVFNEQTHKFSWGASNLVDYQIVNDVLYVANAAYAFSYDFKSQKAKELIKENTVEFFQVVNDDLFYIDHANKTFTIFDLNLKTSQTKIILGKGEERPETDIYHEFLWVEDSLYFFKRMPQGLFQRKDDNETVIDDGDIRNLFSSNRQLYFVSFDLYTSYLYRYDTKIKKAIYVATLKEFYSFGGITVVDGHAYFNSGVEVKDDGGHSLNNYDNSKPTFIELIS